MRCRTFAMVLVVCASLRCLAQAAPASTNPLDDLDSIFVPAYEARVSQLDSLHRPYVEVSGSSLFLHLHGGEPVEARVLTEPYHHLKDVAHAPFTVYLSLVGLSTAELSESQMATVRALLVKLKAAEGALPTAGFDRGQIDRQRQILGDSRHFVEATLASRRVDQEALGRFARAMGPPTLENADEAGCIQIQATHAQMMRWKRMMTKEEWGELEIVITSSHQPRYRNVATQYFSWLMGGASPTWAFPGESSRVIYAETLFPKQTGGDELVSVRLDFEASRAFFGDEWRLSEDLLSSGAARCVGQLLPADRAWQRP